MAGEHEWPTQMDTKKADEIVSVTAGAGDARASRSICDSLDFERAGGCVRF